jgi:hypothetical protein
VPDALLRSCLALSFGLGLFLFAPLSAAAQEPDSTAVLIAEAQQLQRQVAQVQERALSEDTDLSTRQEKLQQSIRAAMVAADSTVLESFRRMTELDADYERAQADQNFDAIMRLRSEARYIQEHISRLENEALASDEIAPRVDAFQEAMLSSMAAIEPKVREWVARLDELALLLRPPPPRKPTR